MSDDRTPTASAAGFSGDLTNHSAAVSRADRRDGMKKWNTTQRASHAVQPRSATPYSSPAPRPTPKLAACPRPGNRNGRAGRPPSARATFDPSRYPW